MKLFLGVMIFLVMAGQPVMAADELEVIPGSERVATTGSDLVLDEPAEVGELPETVNPTALCEQRPSWIWAYVALGVVIGGMAWKLKPTELWQALGYLGAAGVGLWLVAGIMGCACTKAPLCEGFGLVLSFTLLGLLGYWWPNFIKEMK